MRVLIIGGTNFLGPPLARRLLGAGHTVAVFHRGRTRADLPPDAEHILGDRHDLGTHAADFRRFRPGVVVDMIAFTEHDALGLVRTFRGLADRLVVISSADVYRAYGRFLGLEGGPAEPTPLSEDAPLRTALFPCRAQAQGPDDFFFTYDKIPVEGAAMGEPDLPGTVLRLPMVHGPGDPYRRLGAYVKRMDDGRRTIVLDEGMAHWKCPRGHVEDVAAAIALATVDERAAGRTYNVAEPVAYTEAEWVRRVGEAAGWTGRVLTAPTGRISLPFRVEQSLDTDSGRIRRHLGFTEIVPSLEGLRRAVAWERANPADQPSSIGLLSYEAEDELPGKLIGES